MDKYNEKKYKQLGMPLGTAAAKLRKLILFNLLVEQEKNMCYQCGKPIESVEELSIEHKVPWLDSENPTKLFFDLKNIAFSHLKCNVGAARKAEGKKAHQEKCRKGLHHLCKLKEEDIKEIRELSTTMKGTDIAKMFRVSKHTIYRILKGETFNYIQRGE